MVVYLGTKPVGVNKVVEKEVAKTSLGISIDNIISVTDGTVSPPSAPTLIDLSGIENVGERAFSYFFAGGSAIGRHGWLKNVSSVKSIEQRAFYYFLYNGSMHGLTESDTVSFDSLEEIYEYDVFNGFAADASVPDDFADRIRFPALKSIRGIGAFAKFINTSNYVVPSDIFDKLFPVLEEISGTGVFNSFCNWVENQSVTLGKVKKINGDSSKYSSVFSSILKKGLVWNFPSATEFTGYIWNASASYPGEIHFAAANQAAIEACEGYSYKWGYTNASIIFDL